MADTIVQMLVNGGNDLEWYNNNLNRLKDRYNNRFIAFHNKKIIDSDPDYENLMKKLKKQNINTREVFIKFVSKVKKIL